MEKSACNIKIIKKIIWKVLQTQKGCGLFNFFTLFYLLQFYTKWDIFASAVNYEHKIIMIDGKIIIIVNWNKEATDH